MNFQLPFFFCTSSNPLPCIAGNSFPAPPRAPVTAHEPSTVASSGVMKRICSILAACCPAPLFPTCRNRARSICRQLQHNQHPRPKISEAAYIASVKPKNCLIHHASDRPFVLLSEDPV